MCLDHLPILKLSYFSLKFSGYLCIFDLLTPASRVADSVVLHSVGCILQWQLSIKIAGQQALLASPSVRAGVLCGPLPRSKHKARCMCVFWTLVFCWKCG